MINIIKENFNRALFALIFSIITIGTLSFLSFETPYGLFLVGSFGSSMVLLFWISRKPFCSTQKCFLRTLNNIFSWCINFNISASRSIFTNSYCCWSWYICNDTTWCNSPTSRRKSYCYNTRCSFL